MLTFNTITMKNFMSVGAVTQVVSLKENGLTLVLGDNIDQGSNGNRNGAGKTVLIHAVSFALFGVPMTKISMDNLVNKTNNKNMLVTLEFEKDGHTHRIERGRKPIVMRYFIDDVDSSNLDDKARGETKDSHVDILKVLGITHLLFKHIVALSTKTTPFLNEGAKNQRDLIEELLGITQLSEKAEILKENIKETKTEIEREEFRHKLTNENNDKTRKTISQLSVKSTSWENTHDETIMKLERQINSIMEIDIDNEIKKLESVEAYKQARRELVDARHIHTSAVDILNHLDTQIQKSTKQYESLINHRCHACGQDIHDDQHDSMMKEHEKELEVLIIKKQEQEDIVESTKLSVNNKQTEIEDIDQPTVVHYDNIREAYEHKSNMETLISRLEDEIVATNPYIDQIATMEKNNIQEIDYTMMNELVSLFNHQDFLHKLLTRKDSNIRMQIIEQNLSYLNQRLDYYCRQLGLPHQVYFLGDLSVEIKKTGQSFDFDNLSTGESTRLVLALSWSFRDIFEILRYPISLSFIDELIDSGMDSSGGENALAALKHSTRDDKRNIFLISHKDEFVARVSNVLMVEKENGFTRYNYETDLQI